MRPVRFALVLAAAVVLAECPRSAPADEVGVGEAVTGQPHEEVAVLEGGLVHEHGRNYDQPPLDPEPQLAVWSLVVFVLFVLVSRRLAWQPLIEGLNARESRINRALAEARTARARAEEFLREYQQRLAATHDEVRGILAQARREAESAKVEIIAAAERESEQIRDRALAEIDAARDELLAELAEPTERYAETTSQRLLEGMRS